MQKINIKNNAGLILLALRLVVGWTYFSAFWRRTVLVDKLDPELPGYIGEKFNAFLPNALGIKPIIQYMVENPDILWVNMVIFTIIEGIVGLFVIMGLFTRLMSIGVFVLALGILLGSGWIGTTCLDEWQIGVLGVATGFVLFLAGGSNYSLDHYFTKNSYRFTNKRWFRWFASGNLPIREQVFPKVVLVGSLFILGLTMYTNQVFHGGLWGTLHNKSVKPKLEISEAKIISNTLSFDIFRTEGVDVYGAWIISIELLDNNYNKLLEYSQDDLASLESNSLHNYYISKVRPGKHSLVVPLGAKAKLSLQNKIIANLFDGEYVIRLTDISGSYWEQKVIKSK